MKDSDTIDHRAASARKVSVVVCTYNRADLLGNALEALCAQAVPPSEYEVIVVDNNSSDHTRAVAKDFSRRFANVRYCFEPRQGLSHARNRGWQIANGEYAAYIDDDCEAPSTWLSVAKEVIDRVSPPVFGGPYFALHKGPRPRWFKDEYHTHHLGDDPRFLTEREYLSGGNIFFRRTLFQELGGFDPAMGMSGKRIAYGEETALLRRIRAAMGLQTIYYDPRLYVHHLVAPRKMSMPWIIRHRFAGGRYSYRVFQGKTPSVITPYQLLKQAVRTFVDFGVDLWRGAIQRDRTQYPFVQNYLYERAFRHLKTMGKLYEQLRQVVLAPKNRTSSPDGQ